MVGYRDLSVDFVDAIAVFLKGIRSVRPLNFRLQKLILVIYSLFSCRDVFFFWFGNFNR